jgi:hypothetical protein
MTGIRTGAVESDTATAIRRSIVVSTGAIGIGQRFTKTLAGGMAFIRIKESTVVFARKGCSGPAGQPWGSRNLASGKGKL